MNYTKYDKNTGKIVGNIFASNLDDLQINLKETEAALEGNFSQNEYYISNIGEPVKLPLKPEGFYTLDYETKTWIPDYNSQWNSIKKLRNEILASLDWTQLSDVPLNTKEAWASYRQQLRDITLQPDPFNITWPMPPA